MLTSVSVLLLSALGPTGGVTSPGGGFLGGSDDCATPVPLTGTGLFPFDLTGATGGAEGQNEALCLFSSLTAIDSDEWFAWTAPSSGCAKIQTCGGSGLDTKIAAYPGVGCPVDGTALACSDDACNYESSMQFEVTAGSTYTLQIGTFPGVPGAASVLDISIGPCPGPMLNPANGHYYHVIDGFVPWDTARAEAEAATFMGVQGHLATVSEASEDDFIYYLSGSSGPIGNSWLGGYQDMNAPDYSEPAGGWRWVTGEPFTFTDWTPGEPNDGGGAEHYLGYWPADQWNDFVPGDTGVQHYVIEFETDTGTRYCFGDGSGSICPCGNMGGTGEGCANSTGAGARLTGMALPTVVPDDLLFRAEGLLPGQPALLFVGLNATNGGTGLLFGDGLRCAGGSVVRLGTTQPDGAGAAGWGPGLAASGGWAAGDLRRFQVWYRDPAGGGACGSGFNTTNGVEIQFLP